MPFRLAYDSALVVFQGLRRGHRDLSLQVLNAGIFPQVPDQYRSVHAARG